MHKAMQSGENAKKAQTWTHVPVCVCGCVFVGVYKRMYLYYSVHTIDYNYEISHIFSFVFLALLCISACQCVSTIDWFWRSHRDAILSLKLEVCVWNWKIPYLDMWAVPKECDCNVCPNASPQNQTKLDKIDKIRPNKCCCFFVGKVIVNLALHSISTASHF